MSGIDEILAGYESLRPGQEDFYRYLHQHPELSDALREAFGHDGPALVDAHTVREELVELTKSNLRELEVE